MHIKKYLTGLLVFGILWLSLAYGQDNSVEKAKGYAIESRQYYQRAVNLYRELIAKGQDLNRLRFELGRLYYDYGEFEQSATEFQKTSHPDAAKFLALSYYRLGDFSAALTVFNKKENWDDEAWYYCGVTSEKLNLFDQAVASYKKVKSPDFSALAFKRLNAIEKQVSRASIKDISPETHSRIVGAPRQENYPQAGALILYCDESIEITPENSQVSRLHYLVKILNERGKENFSESHIDYDSTYEKVELEYARTIKPDGSVAEVGSRHIRDVSKYLNFPLYSNARVYIVSFPEITEGAVIEYQVKIHRNQLVNKKDFVMSYPVQANEPIIAGRFNIRLPKDSRLHIKTLNSQYNNFGANLRPLIKSAAGYEIYSWEFKNIPQIIPESSMPPDTEINPVIFISTFDSWQEVYDWWWNLAKDKIKPDAAVRAKVAELIKNENSQEAKIRAIYNFCAQKIRYVAVEYGQAGYEPHYAADVFRNKYGDCKDQAILLVTMLREAGLGAWPVLISTKDYYNLNDDFAAILFNHCIAAVSFKGQLVFLDPTAETCAFGDLPADDQARRVLLFQDEGYKIENTPLYPARHNLLRQAIKIKINHDETMEGQRRVFTYGSYDQGQRFWLLYTPPELVEQALKERIQDVSIGAKLDRYGVKNLDKLGEPIELDYSFTGPEYFTLAGNLRIMPQLASVDTGIVAKDKRRYPLDFNILESKETIFEIEIPRDFELKYLPEAVNKDSRWLDFKVGYKVDNNKIIFTQSVELKKRNVSLGEYREFKNFFEDLARRVKQRIVLQRRPGRHE